MFLQDLGIEKSGLDRLIQCSADLLELISFLTWAAGRVPRLDHRGHQGAPGHGKIHSTSSGASSAPRPSLRRDDGLRRRRVAAAREGLLRSEGVWVKDGDMIYFRFNV